MPSNGTNALEKDAFLQKWKSGAEFSLTSEKTLVSSKQSCAGKSRSAFFAL